MKKNQNSQRRFKRRFRNLRVGEEKKHFEMLNFCFNPWGSQEKWRSMYFQEEFDINKNVIVVEENGAWIGGCTMWFREVLLKGDKRVKVQLAGDGYALQGHTGKGVYATSVQNSRERAYKERAALALGFVTVYGGPFVSLLKLGYLDAFLPTTRILVLNPEKFLKYLIAQARYVHFPRKFEGITLRLLVSVNHLKGKFKASKTFQIMNREPCELPNTTDKKADLQISTDVETLFKILRYQRSKRRKLYLFLVTAFLQGHIRFRVSLKFLRRFWKS